MDRNEVIRLAEYVQASTEHPTVYTGKVFVFRDDQIEIFSELVAAIERESCAKVCTDYANNLTRMSHHDRPEADEAVGDCADDIRDRGKQEKVI